MGTKAERRAAGEHVTAYHEARLGELIEYITAAVDRYRAGEIDAYDVDEAIHHYHRAAREPWKFCWSGGGGTHNTIRYRLTRFAELTGLDTLDHLGQAAHALISLLTSQAT